MIDLELHPSDSKKSLPPNELQDYLHQYQQIFFEPQIPDAFTAKIEFDNLILIGIGGSAMGARFMARFFRNQTQKKLIVLDNIHPDWVCEQLASIDLKRSLCVSVSKSGNTLETLVLTNMLAEKYQALNLPLDQHFYLVSDPGHGQLATFAKQYSIDLIEMPAKVGGRFSLFTEAATVPLALLGVDVVKLCSQAQKGFQNILGTKFNVVQTLGEFLYHNHTAGRNNLVIFNYEPRLSWFGSWAAQLICESLGKQNLGFQVVSARGTTDQHSMTQHWKQGTDNTIMVFIEPKTFTHPTSVQYQNQTLELGSLTRAFLSANQQVFHDLKRPSCKFSITDSTQDLVDLSCLWLLTTAYLGAKFQINAFDQPAVDFSKRILQKNLKI